ncbi:GNAT family N-acetyltransferase [Desulfovibrio sulfodismutans]|uniref:GNAT family N-acetyltransferase n=1 Tax=Desulfolutivibrio sulfodismutans TaxID=63561 RepID=A0A7K3NH34_9BACT|nr:GNAT family N-acetyltransferase [Desulfolutivibrio sulfodismutans]NDY55511.1 GNAT family N-acetyltransferase [Desulfolutivibrio sulfodismutans]
MGRERLIRKLLEARREIEPGQDVTIGLFRPEDALGVALAYYEIYGDAFPLEHVYDPGDIIRRNATDDQYTLVARTPGGEVVGLSGLFRSAPNPDLYEAGQLMVLKSYRKRNIPARFSEEALDNLPRRLRIPVIFGEAVCNHLPPQSLLYAHGLAFTGFEAECMPSPTTAREGDVPRNLSLILMFKIFENATRETHTPRAYRAFCQGVYAELALPRVESPSEEPTGRTAADQFHLQGAGLLRLTVTRLGKDFGEAVSAAEAKAGDPGVVQIFLNLGDAAASWAVDVLRDRGYFLGGLLPYWFGSDGLLMQKVRLEPDWAAILVCDPKGAAMRDLIREDYERATCRKHGIA